MLKRWLTLLLLALLPLLANAQSGTIYPIELSVMMTPPYGTCLKECVGSDRITIQALLKDFSKNSSQFVIQLKVTDNKNKVVLMTHFGDYVFQPGQTFTFPMGPNSPQGEKSNVLHDIFANAKVKLQNECFDEGAYTFTFQAFEKSSYPSRKIALSAAFSLPVFLQGNTVAPLPIYPYEDEVLCFESCPYQVRNIKKNATVTNVITYQWQAATISSMRVAYHLQVVDLGDITGKKEAEIKNGAGNAFSSNTPLIVNNRVYTSFFNHQRTENNYRKNHAYAWRVMAVTGDDLEKNLNFNDKSAPVRVFYYCCYPEAEKDTYKPMIDDREFDDELDRMKMDTIETEGLSALAFWKKNDVNMEKYCGIRLEIRPYGQSKWSETFVAKEDLFDENMQVSNSWPLSNLNYDVHYEVRAQYVVCKESKSETDPNRIYAPYSDTINFIVNAPVSDEKACGDNLPDLQPCDPNAIPIITAGSEINADGVTVVVDSVSFPVPDDKSIISGTGHVGLPFFNRIGVRMSFDNVKINCANELVKGRIVSVYDEKYCALIDLDNNGKDPSGGPNKAPTKAKLKKLDPANLAKEPVGQFLYDDDKNVYVKTSDGETQPIGKLVSFNSKEYAFQNSAEESDHCILFYNTDPKIAFDDDEKKIYRNVYYYNQWYGGQNDFVAPWMANNPGKVNGVRAKEYKANNDETSFKSVRFFVPCETGESTESSEYVELNHGVSDDDYTVDIPGWENFDNSMEVFAAAQKEGEETYYNVGKMIAEVYKRRTHKLKIVSLLPGITLDAYKKAAEETLDAIYGSRLGITYQVETEDFSNNEVIKSLDLKGKGLDIAADKEHKWSNNTDMMKKILRAYKDEKEIDKHTAYLFVADYPSEPEYKDVEGDMPVGESAGFLFDSNMKNINIGRLIAHEIGHGVYNLSHTFDQFEKGKTGNLMDYCDGDFLAHHQWKVIDDSTRIVWKFMQDDEDGMGKKGLKKYKKEALKCLAISFANSLMVNVDEKPLLIIYDLLKQNEVTFSWDDLPFRQFSFYTGVISLTIDCLSDKIKGKKYDNKDLEKEKKEDLLSLEDLQTLSNLLSTIGDMIQCYKDNAYSENELNLCLCETGIGMLVENLLDLGETGIGIENLSEFIKALAETKVQGHDNADIVNEILNQLGLLFNSTITHIISDKFCDKFFNTHSADIFGKYDDYLKCWYDKPFLRIELLSSKGGLTDIRYKIYDNENHVIESESIIKKTFYCKDEIQRNIKGTKYLASDLSDAIKKEDEYLATLKEPCDGSPLFRPRLKECKAYEYQSVLAPDTWDDDDKDGLGYMNDGELYYKYEVEYDCEIPNRIEFEVEAPIEENPNTWKKTVSCSSINIEKEEEEEPVQESNPQQNTDNKEYYEDDECSDEYKNSVYSENKYIKNPFGQIKHTKNGKVENSNPRNTYEGEWGIAKCSGWRLEKDENGCKVYKVSPRLKCSGEYILDFYTVTICGDGEPKVQSGGVSDSKYKYDMLEYWNGERKIFIPSGTRLELTDISSLCEKIIDKDVLLKAFVSLYAAWEWNFTEKCGSPQNADYTRILESTLSDVYEKTDNFYFPIDRVANNQNVFISVYNKINREFVNKAIALLPSSVKQQVENKIESNLNEYKNKLNSECSITCVFSDIFYDIAETLSNISFDNDNPSTTDEKVQQMLGDYLSILGWKLFSGNDPTQFKGMNVEGMASSLSLPIEQSEKGARIFSKDRIKGNFHSVLMDFLNTKRCK